MWSPATLLFVPWPPQGQRKTLNLTRLQGGLSLRMNSGIRVCANNDRERDAVWYQHQIFSRRGVVLLLSIKMIEQHVSAFLSVKSRIKALSESTLSLDQPVELLPVLTPPKAHKNAPRSVKVCYIQQGKGTRKSSHHSLKSKNFR